jgi:putative oxidoreductase
MATVTRPEMGSDDVGKLVLRLAVGALLLLHGIFKIRNGVGWMAPMLGGMGLPAFIAYGAYLGEVVAPLLVLAGKLTRLAGLIIAFNMLMAVILALRAKLGTLNQGGGWAVELEMLFLAGGVALFFFGSGRFALSRGLGRWD